MNAAMTVAASRIRIQPLLRAGMRIGSISAASGLIPIRIDCVPHPHGCGHVQRREDRVDESQGLAAFALAGESRDGSCDGSGRGDVGHAVSWSGRMRES
jgi:hypothetical protein